MADVLDDEQQAIRCDVCGVAFAVPAALGTRHERIGRSVWCPNGHLLGSDYREPVSLTLQRTQELAAELGTELTAERQRHAETRRALVIERHRLMLGCCPLCQFEAKGLGVHLRKAHPSYDTDRL